MAWMMQTGFNSKPLMYPVEIANAKVDDAWSQAIAVIGWPGYSGTEGR